MNTIKLRSKCLLLLFGILFISSCSRGDSDYAKLDKFVQQNTKANNLDSIKWVAYLTQRGCIGCNINFARIIAHHTNNKNGIFLLSAEGSLVDISPFIADSVKNVYLISEREYMKLQLTKESGMFFFKNNQIDTIIEIDAKILESQLNYISERISKE